MISVTSYFRDTEAFGELKENLSKVLKAKEASDPIRIWVPGCATGEEPYSLAILLAEHFGGVHNLAQKTNIQIFATDIDTDALSRARKGLYPAATLENLDVELRRKYFRHRDLSFEIVKPLRDIIVFSRHNVLEDPPFLRLDLISCRNMLIYFNNKLQHHVLSLFNYSLLHSGILFLGKSESLGASASLFQTIDSKNKIYQRKIVPTKDTTATIRSTFGNSRRTEEATPMKATNKTLHDLPDSMIQAFAPDSLLIDENMDVVRIYGDIHAFMQIAPGGISTNLMSMARKEFRQELRALAFKTIRENVNSTILPKKMDIQGKMHEVNIIIRPLHLKHSTEKLLVVSFEKVKVIKASDTAAEKVTTGKADPLTAELEQELTATREHLQTVVEELETSNEELQSTNEEMQSTNEELQSSNEELETANEELQSTNEELLTVNEELNIKTSELSNSNDELHNITESINYPLVVVDKELRLKRYNVAAHKLFVLGDDSEDELLTSISTQIDIPDMRSNIISVIEKGKSFIRQIETENVSYLEHILPYRDVNSRIEGAVLTYIDNTTERRAVKAIEQSEERFDLAVDGAHSGIWDWDINNNEMFWSPRMREILNVDSKKHLFTFKDLMVLIHQDDRDDVQAILDAHLERGFDFNLECRLQKDIGTVWINLSGKAIWNNKTRPIRMAGSLNDITERREAIEQLTQSNQSLDRFAYVCSHDLREPVRLIENFMNLYLKKYSDSLDDEAFLYLDHVMQNSSRIQAMIRDILTYSQLENHGTQYIEVNCEAEINKALENLALTIEEKKAIITYKDIPKVRGDQMQIFQLFQNLIGNALKFCKDKAPKIKIIAKDIGDFWEFSVQDNGIGMKTEHAAKIFNVFQRLNPQDEYPGTGIGLSICERAAQRHGGKIWVTSEPGKGSKFSFTLAKNLRKQGNVNASKFRKVS